MFPLCFFPGKDLRSLAHKLLPLNPGWSGLQPTTTMLNANSARKTVIEIYCLRFFWGCMAFETSGLLEVGKYLDPSSGEVDRAKPGGEEEVAPPLEPRCLEHQPC